MNRLPRYYLLVILALLTLFVVEKNWASAETSETEILLNRSVETESGIGETVPQFPAANFSDEQSPVSISLLPGSQDDPAVAYSTTSNQYLVVFESYTGNGDILGQFVDAQTGNPLGDHFSIADTDAREANPDVAYDSFANRFLVVYEVGDEYDADIAGKLTYGKYQFTGNHLPTEIPTILADSWGHKNEPALAYNPGDHQFLLIYSRIYENIIGRYLDTAATYPTMLGEEIGIWDYIVADVHEPEIAWGAAGSNFLVIWRLSGWHLGDIVQAVYVKDAFPYGDRATLGYPEIAPLDPLQNDCSLAKVAYDPTAEAYVVVFNYREGSTTLSPYSVYMQRVEPEFVSVYEPAFNGEPPIPVETDRSFSGHYYPNIIDAGPGKGMLLTYSSFALNPPSSTWYLYTRTLNGTHLSPRQLVRTSPEEDAIEDAVLAAGADADPALLIWREEVTGDDWDILGQWVRSAFTTYIPFLSK